MNELEQILELVGEVGSSEPLALATLVHLQGSAYRRPGARMLITGSGRSIGVIGGGCLDSDLRAQAIEVMASQQARLVTYDSSSADPIVYGFGLGRDGVVRILIEHLPRSSSGLLAFYAACREQQRPGRLVTVFESNTTPNALPVGGRLLLWPDGHITSDLHDPRAVAALTRALFELSEHRAAVRSVDLPQGGFVTALFDSIIPPIPLIIFGGGEDALPLVQFAKRLGRHVTVVDARPAYADHALFAMADSVLCIQPETLREPSQLELLPGAQALIQTRQFRQDREWLRLVLPHDLRYVGIVGSKARTQLMLDELAEDGVQFSDDALGRLHAPAGLDIGALTPAEIAVSVLAEMQASLNHPTGGLLRPRRGAIHQPMEHELLAAS